MPVETSESYLEVQQLVRLMNESHSPELRISWTSFDPRRLKSANKRISSSIIVVVPSSDEVFHGELHKMKREKLLEEFIRSRWDESPWRPSKEFLISRAMRCQIDLTRCSMFLSNPWKLFYIALRKSYFLYSAQVQLKALKRFCIQSEKIWWKSNRTFIDSIIG